MKFTWSCFEDEAGRDHQEDACAASGVVGAVADGMGGHEGGAAASSAAVEAILEELSPDAAQTELDSAFAYAAQQVTIAGGGGTTLAVVLVDAIRAKAAIGWVGDSRAYLVRNEEVELLSDDHVGGDGGLSRWLPDEPCAEVTELDLLPGDLLVLCTDGVWGAIDDSKLASACDADDAAEWIVELAVDAGTADNCAVVTCFVEE